MYKVHVVVSIRISEFKNAIKIYVIHLLEGLDTKSNVQIGGKIWPTFWRWGNKYGFRELYTPVPTEAYIRIEPLVSVGHSWCSTKFDLVD